MSIIKAKEENKTFISTVKPMLLPVYIILSGLFILYVAYSYLGGVVYNSGLNSGASAGQQQGYEAAVIDLMNKVSEKCEPVALTAGETQIEVVNVACLQQAPVETSIPTGE